MEKGKKAKKVTKTKEVKKIPSKKEPKENYFKSVRKEMKLVKWPTFKEIMKYTISTLVFCIIVCVFFLLLTLLLSAVKGWLS